MRASFVLLVAVVLAWGGEPLPPGGRAIFGTVGADNNGGRSATGADDGWRFLQAALIEMDGDEGIGERRRTGAASLIVVLGARDTTDSLPANADCDDPDEDAFSCDQLDLPFHFDDRDTVDALQAVLEREFEEAEDQNSIPKLSEWTVSWVDGADNIERFLHGEAVPVAGKSGTVTLARTAVIVLPSRNEIFRDVKDARSRGIAIGDNVDFDNFGISDEELAVLQRRENAVRLARFCVEGRGGLISLSNGYAWLERAFNTGLSVETLGDTKRGVDHAETEPYSDLLDDQGGDINFSLGNFEYGQVFRRPDSGDPAHSEFEPIFKAPAGAGISGEALTAVDGRLTDVFELPKLVLSVGSVTADADTATFVLALGNDVEANDEALEVTAAIPDVPWIAAVLRSRAPGDPPTNGPAGDTNFEILELRFDRSGLGNGQHSALVRIESNSEDSVILPVTIVVEKPVLALQVTSIELETSDGGRVELSNIGFRELTITNLQVSTEGGEAWLDAQVVLESPGGAPVAIELSVERSGLAAGEYRGTVTIQSNGGTQALQVSMHVSSGGGGATSLYELWGLVAMVLVTFGYAQLWGPKTTNDAQ